MRKLGLGAIVLLVVAMGCPAQTSRWSEQKAEEWYAKQPWLVGSNYIPRRPSTNWKCGRRRRLIRRDRSGVGLGGVAGIQHHAGFLTICCGNMTRRLQEAFGYISEHRQEAPHPAAVCAV